MSDGAPAPPHGRVLHPAPGVLALYDGRVEGYRFAPEPNWVDEGAISLGIASYAILDRGEALVYDTGTSVAHGRWIRETVEAAGGERITVLLSHWHLDHVAGNEAFADCEILAEARTAAHLAANRAAIEAGEVEGPPPIAPLVGPSRILGGEAELTVGERRLRLIPAEIHSDDAVVVWEEATATLWAGDTVEDTVTYVDEPQAFEAHLRDLERLGSLAPRHVLPAHGDPDVIAAGGYGPGLLTATADYVRFLQRCREEPALRQLSLREILADALAASDLRYFEPYETVHRENVAKVLAEN
ncbi:MAG TPA: MBL fold metallo-hydrolase [Solirubrobacterales bacterium]|nr:MBL fold metallo-hydrolase [Solirubrobacterales bacterium]